MVSREAESLTDTKLNLGIRELFNRLLLAYKDRGGQKSHMKADRPYHLAPYMYAYLANT